MFSDLEQYNFIDYNDVCNARKYWKVIILPIDQNFIILLELYAHIDDPFRSVISVVMMY